MWIGENRIDDLSLACKELNISNPLFVTDKDLVSLPMTVEIITNLKNSFGKLNIFSDFTGNPTGKNITEGVKIYNNNSCDGVIAFGGGSAFRCWQSYCIYVWTNKAYMGF
jgi:alcohol dehydrogenase class IV